MDIYELSSFAIEQCPMHHRLDLYSGPVTLSSTRFGGPVIAIDVYDWMDDEEFDICAYERSFKYIVISPCTKNNWKEAYRLARIIKSSAVSKMSGDNHGI